MTVASLLDDIQNIVLKHFKIQKVVLVDSGNEVRTQALVIVVESGAIGGLLV